MVRVTKFKRGDSWYLDWREGSKRPRPSLGNISERKAEELRAAKEAELTYGVRIISKAPRVRDFLVSYLDWYKAEHPTTIGKARSEVKRFISGFGHRPIDTITPFEIEQYKADRLTKNGAANETVGKELRRLKAAFKRGQGWGLFDVNPLASIKAPKGVRSVAVRFYDADALKKLYEANPARAPLWRFMAHTGPRRGEIAGYPKERIVGGRMRIESIPDETGRGRNKSGRWREVPLNSTALAALQELPDPLVSVHADTLSDWFRVDAKEAGIGGTLHRLRHTFGANLTMAGVPLRRIQLLMGHADYATTEKYYAHLTPDGDDEAVKLLDDLLSVTTQTQSPSKELKSNDKEAPS